jgi:hypothetical protein
MKRGFPLVKITILKVQHMVQEKTQGKNQYIKRETEKRRDRREIGR